MDCNHVKDQLIDYIDGLSTKEEEEIISLHLDTCESCRQEYNELCETIEYIANKSNKIHTDRELNLNTKEISTKRPRRFRRTMLIAAILSLMLVATAFATDAFDFLIFWEKSSEPYISAWEDLIDNGVGQKLDISVVDKDIKVTAEGVIADELNTLIFLKIENLSENIILTPRDDFLKSSSISVGGDIRDYGISYNRATGEEHKLPIFVNFVNLYTEAENTMRILLKLEPMTKDEGIINIKIDNLVSFFSPDMDSVKAIPGDWELNIPAKVTKSQSYEINESADFYGGELIVENILIAPTVTKVDYRLKGIKENKVIIDQLKFHMEDEERIYNDSKITSLYQGLERNREGDILGSVFLDSMYYNVPESINFVVDTLTYHLVDWGIYKIDLDNLPQKVDYNGSKITIEDIIYNDDSTELVIKEKLKKDSNIMATDYDVSIQGIVGNKYVNVYTEYEDWVTKDDKGIVEVTEDITWNNKMYHQMQGSKIIIDKRVSSKTFKLIPEYLYIKSQDYIDYPNTKIKIDIPR